VKLQAAAAVLFGGFRRKKLSVSQVGKDLKHRLVAYVAGQAGLEHQAQRR